MAPSIFDGDGFDDRDLRELYLNSSGPIAYIDESYSAPKQARGNGFYLLTAVILERDRVSVVRSKLRTIARVERWHTTDAAGTTGGPERIVRMTRYLADTATSVIAAQTSIPPSDRDADGARAQCFEMLLGDLCDKGELERNGLVVIERRRDIDQRREDGRTVNRLRSRGIIHRNLLVHQGSPAGESLLWAPDVVSWAARQTITRHEKTYLEPLARAKSIRFVRAPYRCNPRLP
jgi:hypothetical protein